MKPAEIRYKLDLNEVSQASIATRLKCDAALVSRVINGSTRSERVAKAIAAAIGCQLEEAFPAYEKQAA